MGQVCMCFVTWMHVTWMQSFYLCLANNQLQIIDHWRQQYALLS
jgi:hypothetical protein